MPLTVEGLAVAVGTTRTARQRKRRAVQRGSNAAAPGPAVVAPAVLTKKLQKLQKLQKLKAHAKQGKYNKAYKDLAAVLAAQGSEGGADFTHTGKAWLKAMKKEREKAAPDPHVLHKLATQLDQKYAAVLQGTFSFVDCCTRLS